MEIRALAVCFAPQEGEILHPAAHLRRTGQEESQKSCPLCFFFHFNCFLLRPQNVELVTGRSEVKNKFEPSTTPLDQNVGRTRTRSRTRRRSEAPSDT